MGAGPGDPSLLTRRGADLLSRADVVVYDGLIDMTLLDLTSPHCECIYAGKKHAAAGQALSQEQINATLVDQAKTGKRVVRLKGGDPFVFGRGAEECRTLHDAGIPFEIVPGVTSATAVPAYAGIPLTARYAVSTVGFATGHEADGKQLSDVDWRALAGLGTIVLFMAVRTVADCARHLIAAGRAPETPAAAIHWGTTPRQRTTTATLAQLADKLEQDQIKPPALVIIGEVVDMRQWLSWFEQRPLFGKRILIARNLEQASPCATLISEYGGDPIVMPVTRIDDMTSQGASPIGRGQTAAGGDKSAAPLAGVLDHLTSYAWLAFASANAVNYFFAALYGAGRDCRALANTRLACVGTATAAALRQHGLVPDVLPESHGFTNDGVGLANAIITSTSGQPPEPADARDARRILLPRAANGRTDVIDTLRRNGFDVDPIDVYRTVARTHDDPIVGRGVSLLAANDVDAIALFAPSQVDALMDIAHSAGIVDRIRSCACIAAIGHTTNQALQAHGLSAHLVASQPNAAALIADVADFFSHRESKPSL